MSFILIPLGIVLFILFFVPIFFNVLNFANIIGMLISSALIFYGIFFRKINITLKLLWQNSSGKALLSAAFIAVVCAFLCVMTISVLMIGAAGKTPPKETTVVVLGCKVNPGGPSIMLETRLQAAFRFLTENPDSVCVLSGGQGADEPVSEAEAMCDWLKDRGISEDRLFPEDKSTSTRENLLFSKEVIEKNNLPSDVTVITNEFHQYRAKIIAKKLGIDSYSYSAKTPFYFFPTYYVREIFGILYEWL